MIDTDAKPQGEPDARNTAPEVAWFSALCDDDYEFLGVRDPALASSYEHCRDIVLRADRGGFDNILLPSGYQLGIDSVAFAGAVGIESFILSGYPHAEECDSFARLVVPQLKAEKQCRTPGESMRARPNSSQTTT